MTQDRRLVFFDIDGTLVMTMGAGKNALNEVFMDTFGITQPNLDINFGGRTDRSIAKELFDLNDIEHSHENLQLLFDRYVTVLDGHLQRSAGYILPGILELLTQLAAHENVDIGLITGNVKLGAYRKLERFDIDSYFDFGGFGDNQELRSGIAQEALDSAHQRTSYPYKGDQIVVIGDTAHDVECSRAIHARCLAVATGYADKDSIAASNPDILFENLSHTDDVLRFIFS